MGNDDRKMKDSKKKTKQKKAREKRKAQSESLYCVGAERNTIRAADHLLTIFRG
jgi:hypothetical protein